MRGINFLVRLESLLVLASVNVKLVQHVAAAYSAGEQHHRPSPTIDRRAIAGLWKLSRLPSSSSMQSRRPLKEFTVYPKKNKQDQENNQKMDDESTGAELLLMLNEDGSFKRYFYHYSSQTSNVAQAEQQRPVPKQPPPPQQQQPLGDIDVEDRFGEDHDDDEDVTETWGKFMKYQKNLDPSWNNIIKGTWDLRDGELILAADRLDNKEDTDQMYKMKSDGENTSSSAFSSSSSSSSSESQSKKPQDTVLVGAVVATQEQSSTIVKHQAEQEEKQQQQRQQQQQQQQQQEENEPLGTRLSVPKGSVQVGKFFYPKKHPSFFDQPIFQPKSKGTFQLRQILGTLNTKQEKEPQIIEKFCNKQFYNKRFLLTTHPIQPRRGNNNRSGNLRWSIHEKKFVDDKKKKEEEAAANRLVPIRAMEIMFYSNNTFSTLAGVGDHTILRGTFDVIGKEKDQLWMQIRRFGFGRSVSGSTYSEGIGLSHEEDKTYWGEISHEDPEEQSSDTKGNKNNTSSTTMSHVNNTINSNDSNHEQQEEQQQLLPLQASGSVFVGWGCEPTSVARFIMREATTNETTSIYDDDDDDDDDDENDNDDNYNKMLDDIINTKDNDDDIDWSNSFQ